MLQNYTSIKLCPWRKLIFLTGLEAKKTNQSGQILEFEWHSLLQFLTIVYIWYSILISETLSLHSNIYMFINICLNFIKILWHWVLYLSSVLHVSLMLSILLFTVSKFMVFHCTRAQGNNHPFMEYDSCYCAFNGSLWRPHLWSIPYCNLMIFLATTMQNYLIPSPPNPGKGYSWNI